MSAGFVPTTADVRNAWWRDQCPPNDIDLDDIYNAGFDRWLTAHDAEVAAKAVTDFALVYLPTDLYRKAQEHANTIREGGERG